jgi:T5SS/PEP-CTERM-associated repeat protein
MKKSTLSVFAAAGLAAIAGHASAQVMNWNNAAGGAASTAGNWNPAAVPGATNDLVFNLLAANYPVTFNASSASSRSHTYKRGTVTLTMSSAHTAGAGGLIVGDASGDSPIVNLTTGVFTSTASCLIGVQAGSSGVLNVNDDDADLIVGAAGGTSDLFVGSNGAGTLTITGGGSVVVADQLVAGNNQTSTSNVTISGVVAQFPFSVSTLQVNGVGQSRFGQGGDATVLIANGARAEFGGDLAIALGSASTSTVTVQGSGLVAGATLDVAGDLLVGRNTTAGTAAGIATLNANTSGRVLVGDTLFVGGDPDGGTATLHMSANSLIRTASLNVGSGATLDLDGGELDVQGGTFVWSVPGTPAAILGGADHPVVTMFSGATATFPQVGTRALTVGGGTGANLADFDFRNGSDLTIGAGGTVVIGEGTDDSGSMIFNGAGSTLTAAQGSTIIVGSAGQGRFEAELDADVAGDSMAIATGAASVGVVLFENLGTTASFKNIFVGGSSAVPGADGTLVVNAQADLTMTPGGILKVWPTGVLHVSGGAVIQSSTPLELRGTLELQSGAVVNAQPLVAFSGASIRAHPFIPGLATIDADTTLAGGSLLELINGDLSVGRSASPHGFEASVGSEIRIGANALTLNDSDRADIGLTSIAGGSITAANGIIIRNNTGVDGFGTINGDIFFDSGGGVITATTPAGITFNGLLSNNSGNIDGTRFRFNAPGGWTGAGGIFAKADFHAGTVITARANMTIGTLAPDGAEFAGITHVGDNILTLLDSNGVALGELTDMDDGRIVCAQPLAVNRGRSLEGDGTVETPSLSITGSLVPKRIPDDDFARIRTTGALTFGLGANVFLDIFGRDFDTLPFDRIIASGPLTLEGALHVSLANGFQPTPGDVYPLITGSSRTGVFPIHDIPPHTAVEYTSTSVLLHILCPADFNLDGTVDFFDYLDFVAAFDAEEEAADFNRDGSIDFFDYLDFAAVFDSGC